MSRSLPLLAVCLLITGLTLRCTYNGPTATAPVQHAVPHNVRATYGIYLDSIVVSWSAADSAMFYRVYRSLALGSGYVLLRDSVRDTVCVDDTVVRDSFYYYRVSAVDADSESVQSEPAVGLAGDTTDSTVLRIPRNVNASDGISLDSVSVSWSRCPRAVGYDVHRLYDRDTTDTLIAANLTDTVFADTSAGPGPYKYGVAARYPGGHTSKPSPYDTGYRKVTAREFLLAYNNSTVYTSQHKMTLLQSQQLGVETVAGSVSGTASYNAYLPSLGNAQVDISYINYCDDYFTIDSMYSTLVTWSGRNGNLTGAIKTRGIYPGTVEYHVVISNGVADGGYYRITQAGDTAVDVTYDSVRGVLLY